MFSFIYHVLWLLICFNVINSNSMERSSYEATPQTTLDNLAPFEIWHKILLSAACSSIRDTLKHLFDDNIEQCPFKIGTLIEKHFTTIDDKAPNHVTHFLNKLKIIHPATRALVADPLFIQSYKKTS